MAKSPHKPTPPRRLPPATASRRKRSTAGKVIGAGIAAVAAGGVGTALHNESIPPPSSTCGGSVVQRWPIKVATDDDALANKIALDSGNSVFKVSDLNEIQPSPLDSPHGRMPAEMRAYRVHGYLSYFTRENGKTGDQDYHVVIADTPGDYVTGKNNATGHSMVVEFPNPSCFAGKHGDLPHISALKQQIADARATFEDHLHGIPKDVRLSQQIPVTVTGIGFFDEAPSNHLPTGHSKIQVDPRDPKHRPVVFELHPVTQVQFDNDPDVD